MTVQLDPPGAQRSLRRRPLARWLVDLTWLSLLGIAAYMAIGYGVLPRLIQGQGLALANQYLDGRLSLHHVSVNPLTFEVHLQGLEIRDGYGDLVASAAELLVDWQPRALWSREIRFKRIQMSGPWLNLIREEGGGFNLVRLFDRAAWHVPDSAAQVARYRLSIDELAVINGMAAVTDNRDLTPARVKLLPISFTLRDLASAADGRGSKALQIGFADGGILFLEGQVSLQPVRAEGQLRISNLSTVLLWRFLRDEMMIAKPTGRLDLAARYRFDWRAAQPLLTISHLQTSLSDLVLRQQAASQPFLQVARASLRDGHYRSDDNAFSAAELRVEGAFARGVWQAGVFDWRQVIARDPARTFYTKDHRSTPSFVLNLERVDLSAGALLLEDHHPRQPLQFAVDDIDGAFRFLAQRTRQGEDMRINDLRFSAKAVELRQQDAGDALLALDHVHLNQGEIDLLGERIGLADVTLEGGRALLERRADASTNWRTARESFGARFGGRTAGIGIEQIRFADLQFMFKDMSQKPAFVSEHHALEGSISGISTTGAGTASVCLNGLVGDFGTVAVQGRFDPRDPSQRSAITVQYQDIDMTALSPYSAESSGHEILEGQLSSELSYRIEAQRFQADHRILMERLVWGDEVESPAAFALPLAFAVLQDSEGRTLVDISVEGGLSDPQFNYPELFWQGLRRPLTRAARSPFRVLGVPPGATANGLAEVSFPIGAYAPLPSELDKLATIGGVLQQRNRIQLVIRPVFAVEQDARALQAQALNRALAQRLDIPLGRRRGEVGPFDFSDPIVREEFEGLFVRRRGPRAWLEANLLIPPEETPEARYAKLHAQLAASETLPQNALKQLAIKRAQAIADALTDDPGTAALRIRSAAPVEAAVSDDGAFVAVKLNLEPYD